MNANRVTLRELIIQTALLVALLVPVYPGTFLRREITLPGDILFIAAPWKFHAPETFEGHKNPVLFDSICQHTLWYKEVQDALEAGEWPLWNHLQNTGMPLLANYQTAVFYPPRLLHVLFDNYTAITLFFVLRLWLCGATAYLCGRGIGLGVPAARFLSVGWMLGSYNLLWSYWPEPDVSAWLPVLFLGAEWLVAGRIRKGFACMVTGAVLILLAGHPETAFTMSYGAGIYFVLRLILRHNWRHRLAEPLAAAALAWGVALLITCVQWLPFLEYLTQSYTFLARPEGESTVTTLSPRAILCFWVPRYHGFTPHGNFRLLDHSNYATLIYPGIAAWLGAALVLVRGKNGERDYVRPLCVAIPAVFAALLAFNSLLVAPIQKLPVFSSMWYIWHIGFTVFALPLLGALGIEQWYARKRSLKELLPAVFLALLAGVLVYGFYRFESRVLIMEGSAPYVRRQLFIAVVFTAAALALLAANCIADKRRILGWGIAALLACDLLAAVHGQHVTVPKSWMFPPTPLTDYLRTIQKPNRVCSATSAMQTGLIPVYGIEQWLGYDGLYPLRVKRLQVTFGKQLWDTFEPACAISHYLHLAELENPLFPLRERPGNYELLTEFDGIEVYRNKTAMPRAYLVNNLKVFDSVGDMFAFARTGAFDPHTMALLEAPAPPNLPEPTMGNPGTATVTARTSTRMEIAVTAETPAVLVAVEAYYPGWKAWLDEQRAEIFPVNSAFRGVIVPKGAHTVVFAYEPASFRVGLWVSVVSLLLAAVLGVTLLWRATLRSAADA
ncbi:MAG TPA: YfhO family protein [Candidatus Hydrogenedentes bacterium]|nr:YfhO family protein [Candidatus Hydrogenedentota bacterium]